MKLWIILLIILVILCVALFFLYRYGTKMQKRQEEAQQQMEATKQTVSILVIDKKQMKLKESGLPQAVIDQTPKYLRRSKVPIVKAKVGPKIMTLMCDPKVYEVIPVKTEVKAQIAGIYIVGVRGMRTALEKKPEKKSLTEKVKGFFKKEEEPAPQNKNKKKRA